MTNFAVTLNCAVLHLLQGSWLQTPVQKHGVWKNEMLCIVHYTSNIAVVCGAVPAGCQCNRSGWLLCISKPLFVVCAGWRMCCFTVSTSPYECCIHVLCYCIITFWMLYACVVLLYHHFLNAVWMCCVTVSSLSECCMHVLCYCIITFWMLYACAVLLYPHVTFWMLYPYANLLAICHTGKLHMLIHIFFTFFTFNLFYQMF